MESVKPLISIILSLYNSERMLNCCLDSLVFQTLENIEIIIVEKQSTDNSLNIARDYAKQYPDKVRLYEIPYSDSPGTGRNYGLTKARADYIAFSDTDDFWNLHAMKMLYNHVIENQSDIVMFYANLVSHGEIVRLDRHINTTDISKAICYDSGVCTFWNKLWKKDLLQLTGNIPENTRFEDIAYVPAAISNANKISTLPRPLYYYILDDGISKNKNSLTRTDLLISWEALLSSNYNLKYKDEIFTFLARRIIIAIRGTPRFCDDYIFWVKEHKHLFLDNEVLKKRSDIYQIICKYINSYNIWIPKIIYINAFGKKVSKNWIKHIKSQAFNFGRGQLVVLNEKNCNINKFDWLKIAYENKEYNFLGHYFALKKIYAGGGYYIGERIEIITSFNSLRYYEAFFSFIDSQTISDDIFGSISNNSFIFDLISTYENPKFYDNKYLPLADRIRNIMVSKYDLPLNGQNFRNRYFAIFNPSLMVYDNLSGDTRCIHKFKYLSNNNDFQIMKTSTIKWIAENVKTINKSDQKDIYELNRLYTENKRLSIESDRLRYIESTNSWKFMCRMHLFFDNTSIGRLLKKPIKLIVKLINKRNNNLF